MSRLVSSASSAPPAAGRMLAPALAAALAVLSSYVQAAPALSCPGGAAFCTLDLPHVTLRFDAGPSGQAGVYGTPVGEQSLLQVWGASDDTISAVAGSDGEGFSFYTAFAGSYAEYYFYTPPFGPGYWRGAGEGYSTSVSLYNVSFIAKAGYRVDELVLSFTGLAVTTGNGTAILSVSPSDTHQTTTDQWGNVTHTFGKAFAGTDTGQIDLSFATTAAPEGNGGHGSASLRDFRILARVSAVPEPATWTLLAAGAAAMAAVARRGKR